MKLTTQRLKKLIKEEYKKITEAESEQYTGYGKRDPIDIKADLEEAKRKLTQLIEEEGWRSYNVAQVEELIEHLEMELIDTPSKGE